MTSMDYFFLFFLHGPCSSLWQEKRPSSDGHALPAHIYRSMNELGPTCVREKKSPEHMNDRPLESKECRFFFRTPAALAISSRPDFRHSVSINFLFVSRCWVFNALQFWVRSFLSRVAIFLVKAWRCQRFLFATLSTDDTPSDRMSNQIYHPMVNEVSFVFGCRISAFNAKRQRIVVDHLIP